MNKYKPLLLEEGCFFVLFVLLYCVIHDPTVELSRAAALCIVFEAAIFFAYHLCWFRLRVYKLTAFAWLTDGFFVIALIGIFAAAMVCLQLFGFQSIGFLGIVYFSIHYADLTLFANIILISIMIPDAHSLFQPFDPEGDDDDDFYF